MSNNHRERLAPEAELTLHVLYPFQIIMEDYDPRVGQSFERWARNMAALVCIWNTLPEADRKLQASRFTGELHTILMDFVLAVAERARKVRDRLQQQDQG